MRYSSRALISVGWLMVYNLGATYTEPVQSPVVLYYPTVGLTYLPMLFALLVWLEQPKRLYRHLEYNDS